jgi:beta-1,4-mannooligosaccharide/beta-1,4-mannosyl-N-acetylglucosamine phosphorylase
MPEQVIGELKSSPLIVRHEANPVLRPDQVPSRPALVFNAGVTKYQGRYVMVFRNDYLRDGAIDGALTDLGLAFSDDGVRWEVQDEPCFRYESDEIIRAYDPRLTVIDGRCYMCFAVDTHHGVCGGIAVTDDFQDFAILSTTTPDNRNMVLFDRTIGDMYVRLERPFPVYSRGGGDRFDIWISESPDLVYWGNPRLLLAVEDVPFANDKIGPGAPPVRTEKGWLTTFHAVDLDPSRGVNGWEDRPWRKRYTAGIMLLDLQDPSKVVGMCETPLLAPEAPYETAGGYRNDVIFPGGMILEDDGEVKIYYGAADTVECLATASVRDLLKLCLAGKPVRR